LEIKAGQEEEVCSVSIWLFSPSILPSFYHRRGATLLFVAIDRTSNSPMRVRQTRGSIGFAAVNLVVPYHIPYNFDRQWHSNLPIAKR